MGSSDDQQSSGSGKNSGTAWPTGPKSGGIRVTRGLQGVPTDGPVVEGGDLGAPSLPQDWSGSEGLRDFSHFSADAYGVGLRSDLNAGQEAFASQPEHWSPGSGLFPEPNDLSDPFEHAWQQQSNVLSESSSAFVQAHPSSDAFDGLPEQAVELEAGEADEIFEDYSEADFPQDGAEQDGTELDGTELDGTELDGADHYGAIPVEQDGSEHRVLAEESAFHSALAAGDERDAFAPQSEPELASARPTSTSSGAALPFAYDDPDDDTDAASDEPSGAQREDSLDDDEVFDDTRTTLAAYDDDAPREDRTHFRQAMPQEGRDPALLGDVDAGADLPFAPHEASSESELGASAWELVQATASSVLTADAGLTAANDLLADALPESDALALPSQDRASRHAADEITLEDATLDTSASPEASQALPEEAALEDAALEDSALEDAALEDAAPDEPEASLEEAALEDAALEEAAPDEPEATLEESALEEPALEESAPEDAALEVSLPSAARASYPEAASQDLAESEITLGELSAEELSGEDTQEADSAPAQSSIQVDTTPEAPTYHSAVPSAVDPEPSIELELTGDLLPLDAATSLAGEAEALPANPPGPPSQEQPMLDSPEDKPSSSPLLGLETVRSELDQLLGGMHPLEGSTSRPLDSSFPFRSADDSAASIEIDPGEDPTELMPPASIEAADPDELPEPPAEADALMLPEADPPADVGWDRASMAVAGAGAAAENGRKPGSSETTTELRMTSWADVRALSAASSLEPVAEAVSVDRLASDSASSDAPPSDAGRNEAYTAISRAVAEAEADTGLTPGSASIAVNGAETASDDDQEAEEMGDDAEVLAEDAGSDDPAATPTLEAPSLLSETAARFVLHPSLPLPPSEPIPSIEARLDNAIRILKEESTLAEPEQQAAWGLEVASLYVERGDRDAAVAQLLACVETVPDFVPALRGLAALAEEAGEHEAQASWISRRNFAETSPEAQAAVLYSAASLRLQHGLNPSETLRLLEGASELLGPHVELLETLATLQESLAHPPHTLPLTDKQTSNEPTNDDTTTDQKTTDEQTPHAQTVLLQKALETWRLLASAAAPLTGQALVAGKPQRARALTHAARLALEAEQDVPRARALLHEALDACATYAPARLQELRLNDAHASPATRLELLGKTLAHSEGPLGLIQALEAVSLASQQAREDGGVLEQATLQRAVEVGGVEADPLHPLGLELLGTRLRSGAWQETVGQLREAQEHLPTPESQALLLYALALLCEVPLREPALAASRLEEAIVLIQKENRRSVVHAGGPDVAEASTNVQTDMQADIQADRHGMASETQAQAPWSVARERLRQLNGRCGQIGSVAAGLVEEAEQTSNPVLAAARLFQAARLYRDTLSDAQQARTCLCRALDLDPHPLYALALRRSLLEYPPQAPEALIALAELTASVLAQTLDPTQPPPPPEAIELEMHAARAEVQHPEVAWQLYEAALEQGSRSPMVLEGLRRLATTPESRELYLRQLSQLEEDTQNPRTRLVYLWEQLELLSATGRKLESGTDASGERRASTSPPGPRSTLGKPGDPSDVGALERVQTRLQAARNRILAITESLPLLEDQKNSLPSGAEASALRQRIQALTGEVQEHPLDGLALQLQHLVEGLVNAVTDPEGARSQNAELLALPRLDASETADDSSDPLRKDDHLSRSEAERTLEASRPVFVLFQALLRGVTRDVPAHLDALARQSAQTSEGPLGSFLRLRLACLQAYGGGTGSHRVEGGEVGLLLELLASYIRQGNTSSALLDTYEHLASHVQQDIRPLFEEAAGAVQKQLVEGSAEKARLLQALQELELRAARAHERAGDIDAALAHYAQVWERTTGSEDDPATQALAQEGLAGVLRLSPDRDHTLSATAFSFVAEHSLDALDRARCSWKAGAAWEALGEPDKAEVWLSRAMRHPFYRERAGRRLLELYRNAGSVRGVTSLYEPRIQEEQRPLRRLGLEMDLADQLEGFGALSHAVAHFERLSRQSHYLPACLRLERIHLASEDWNSYVVALESRAESVKSEAIHAETRALIHQIKAERLRDPWAMEQALQEELRHDPTHDPALNHLRGLLASQERWTDLALFLEALSGRPMDEARKVRLLLDAAWIYAQQLGDLDVAWQRYQEVLDRMPGDPEALTALKDLCLRRHDWNGLVSVLARQAAGESGGTRLDLYRQIAEVWDQKLNDPHTALAAWEQVRLETPDDPQVLQPMLELSRRLARWELFVPLGEALLTARAEDDAVLLLELAAASIRHLGDPTLGVGLIRRASALGAHAYDLLRQAAELHESHDEWREASQLYLELGYQMPPNTPQLQALQVESLQRLALLSRDHLADPLLAARSWIEVLQRIPDHLAVMWLLAQLYFEHNQHDDARETLVRLIRHPAAANYLEALSAEERLRFHRLMGRLQDEVGDHPAAIAHLEVALQLAPDDPSLQSALAGLYRASGDWARYIGLLKSLIQATPETATELRVNRFEALAEACHAHGDDEEALIALQNVRALVPGRIGAYRLAARILESRGAWTVLLELYNGLIKHGSEVVDVVEAYLRKADILGDMLAASDSSRLPKAVLHYEKALQYDRRNAYAMLRLAESSLRTLQYQKADDWLRRVLAVEPSPQLQARMWFLGAIFAAEAQRSPDKALANMKRAIEHAPELLAQQEAVEAALGRSPGNMEALLKAYRALLPVEALQQRG